MLGFLRKLKESSQPAFKRKTKQPDPAAAAKPADAAEDTRRVGTGAPDPQPPARSFLPRSDIAHRLKRRLKKKPAGPNPGGGRGAVKSLPDLAQGRATRTVGGRQRASCPPRGAASLESGSANVVTVVELSDCPAISAWTTRHDGDGTRSWASSSVASIGTGTPTKATTAMTPPPSLDECEESGFAALPLELVALVLSFLPPSSHDLCNASAVCWSWRALVRSDSSLTERRRQHWRHVNWRTGRFYLRNSLPLKTHPIWQLLPRPHTRDKVLHYSGMDGTVQLLDLKSGELNTSLTLPSRNFPVMAVNESCTRMVISMKKGQGDFAVEEYDFHSGELIRSISSHVGWITCLQFFDDNKVVTGSQDHTLKLWDLDKGECRQQFEGHVSSVTCLHVLKCERGSADGSPVVRLVSGAHDGSIKVWDVATGEALRSLGCGFPVLALHAEGNLVVAAGCKKENRTSEKGCLKLWDWEKGSLLRDVGCVPRGHKVMAPISGVFLSGSRMLTVESGWMSFRCRKFRKTGAIRLWDVSTGQLISKIADFRMREHTNKSQCVVSLLVDDDKNVIVGIEEMEHIKPSSLSHVFKIKSMVKVWSLKESK